MPSGTVGRLLLRGLLAGLIAGLVAFVFAYTVGEGPVSDSIAQEQAHSAPAGHHDHGGGAAAGGTEDATAHEHGADAGGGEEEPVGRDLQSTAGLATGVLVYGVAVGGIAALAFCFALGRVGRFGPRATAALVAGAAFVTVYFVPFLKYPANPPAVGDPDTIGKRTALFFLMIALSVLIGVAAVILGKRLAPRLGTWNATVAAGLGYAVVMAVLAFVLPPNDDAIPEGFPAALLWDFRLASIGLQVVLWTGFALLFGTLADRALAPAAPAAERAPLAAPAV
ncbi:CbtA family protein [Kitasatospora purpeofusca]|uniref:CbtA family protein n=1 Tax=Kitasatospora purpeofusca TaxID=67352 RepID=UPI002A5A3504|nr:CbtA family protein [Kitasatospora purpeofusca]MDY0814072.1 CbtA family protein [Kitasatospora purpeofusca]